MLAQNQVTAALYVTLLYVGNASRTKCLAFDIVTSSNNSCKYIMLYKQVYKYGLVSIYLLGITRAGFVALKYMG